MDEYRHILVAIEPDAAGKRLLRRAKSLAQRFEARLSVLHVVEYVLLDAGDGIGLPPPDLTDPLTLQLREQLLLWCGEFGIEPAALHVVIDSIKNGIVSHAERHGIDLIIVGHHRRQGLSALFSHTEEGVMSRARCDVLAVAVDD